MIVHVNRFSFKPGVTEEERAEVLAAMKRTASVESVAFGSVGQDLGDPADGYTHAFLAAVPDLDALERYMHDPVHLAGDELILDRLAKQTAVRMSDDPDPRMRQEVFAVYDRKVGMYPDWGRKVESLFGDHPSNA